MSISDPNGPFGFNFWLNTHEQHTDLHAGDEFEVGDLNELTGGDAGNATIIANNRHDNVAFAGRNLNTGANVMGIYGDSAGGAGGSVGVAGACDSGWGLPVSQLFRPSTRKDSQARSGSLEPVISSAYMARADLWRTSAPAPCPHPTRARGSLAPAISLVWKAIVMGRAVVSLERVFKEKASSVLAFPRPTSGYMGKAWLVRRAPHCRSFRGPEC